MRSSASYDTQEQKRHTFGLLRPPLLNDQLIQPQLLRHPFQHPLLYAALRDEPENINLLRLPNTMGPIGKRRHEKEVHTSRYCKAPRYPPSLG
jgi:hypothetical protein